MVIADGTVYRLITDHLGCVRLVVNVADGTVVQRLDYDAFGRVLQDTNPGFQPFGYAGGIYDDDTGLMRFGVRDYDAHSGRWTTKDPILQRGSLTNFYHYAANNPVSFIDASGLRFHEPRGEWGGGEAPSRWHADTPSGRIWGYGTPPTGPNVDLDFVEIDGTWHKILGGEVTNFSGDLSGWTVPKDWWEVLLDLRNLAWWLEPKSLDYLERDFESGPCAEPGPCGCD